MNNLQDEVKNHVALDNVIKSDVAKKYYDLQEKCEEAVYGDPDGETDQTEAIAEIVCDQFNIM